MAAAGPARAQGLSDYVGTGAALGTREAGETRNDLLAGGFFDWGVAQNALLRGSADRCRERWTLAADALYVFPESSPLVRPYAGAGAAKDPDRGPWRPDVRLGLVLLGFGMGNLAAEARWLQVAADFTVGYMSPL